MTPNGSCRSWPKIGIVVEAAVAEVAAKGDAVEGLFLGEGHLQDSSARARQGDGLPGRIESATKTSLSLPPT